MNLQVFCYVGLLRFPEQLESCLALLADKQRAEAASFLESVRDLPRTELLNRWSKLREDEYAAVDRVAHERLGIRLDEVAPSIRPWCVSWLADQNG